MNLPVFLDYFKESDETFLLHQGVLYTMHSSNGLESDDFLSLRGNKYSLCESEDIDTLQEEYFTLNRRNIEEFLTDHVQKNYVDKLNELKGDIDVKKNIFGQMQDTSIERFIATRVFDEYCNLYSFNKIKREIPKVDIKLKSFNENVSRARFDVSDIGGTQVGKYLNNISVLVYGQRAYRLEKNSNEKGKYISLKGVKYALKNGQTLDALIDNYKNVIKKSMEQIANRDAAQYAIVLKEYAGVKNQLDGLITRESGLNGMQESARRSKKTNSRIGFIKKSNAVYDVFVDLDPYIIKKNNEYYRFDGVRLGNSISVNRNRVKLTGKAKVMTPNYHHPFVYSNMEICYNSDNRFAREGVTFSYFDMSNMETNGFAKNVAVALNVARKVLERGYIGRSVVPVNTLNVTNFAAEHFSNGASAASGTRIRIIDNDGGA